jgi:DNA-binding NarL/FixJ family response regulator
LNARVLIVDDYQPWRRHVRTVLHQRARWEIVGEGSNGIDAIEKALLLRPDLILLDVALPVVSGIHAAREILSLCPSARILFVSEHRSLDIVEAALETGARGYLVKSDAGAELLTAMRGVVTGKPFLSGELTGRVGEKTNRGYRLRRHDAGFYREETLLTREYARFVAAALRAGKSVIVAAVGSRRATLHRQLQVHGIDLDRAAQEGRYLPFDVADVLSSVMLDGRLVESRFWDATTSLIMRAANAAKGEHVRVAACGECAPTLWQQGATESAIQLERWWDEVSRIFNVDIFCGYASMPPRDDEAFRRICATHSTVHSQ